MEEMVSKTRLFIDQDLMANCSLVLSDGQTHYLRNVLRLRVGDNIGLFNGRDGEWVTRITKIEKRLVEVFTTVCSRPQEESADIWLAFAPIKGARVDFIAQKATELGVSVLWPVFTEYTAMGRINLERLRLNAIEAAEQSGRLSVPKISTPVNFDEFVETWPKDRILFCCDETGGGIPILEAFKNNNSLAGLMIGPEGGFAKLELDQLDKLGNVCRVSLGKRILRSDTAAFAALACWQAIAGDWNSYSQTSQD
jgi:16S rRNA (uracil1498-N3)-methyltransferase